MTIRLTGRKDHNRWLRKILSAQHFNIVLDLGCGEGTDDEGNNYSDYYSFDHLIRIDKEEGCVNSRGKTITYPIDIVARAESLPIEDNSINFIFSNWVFYHTNMPQALREMQRVLIPKEYVMISYWGGEKIVGCESIRNLLKSAFDITELFEHVCDMSIGDDRNGKYEAIYGRLK